MANNYIPYGKQNIDQSDVDAVVKVLKSDFLTQGPAIGLFEKSISDYCDVQYAIASNSATSSLHIACLALGLKSGDYLWTSPNSFVASANCGLYCNANIDFVDINLETLNICSVKLEEKLIKAKKQNKLPKIVIPVHFGGQSCNMEKIYQLSLEYGFKIIEDASHAIGGTYKNHKIGCCEFSDICIFSFHPVKVITSGEGGIATTNNGQLEEKMMLLRSHGITRDVNKMINFDSKKCGAWYYEQQELGLNYRMTDIHAALGLSQMQRLDTFVQKRNEIATVYKEKLNKNIKIQKIKDNCNSSYHLFVILAENEQKRRILFDKMRANNIGVNVHYMPIYLQPYYQKNFEFKTGYCPNAEEYYSKAISIPMYYGLKEEELEFVVDIINNNFYETTTK